MAFPALTLIAAGIGARWLGWFQPRSRRRVALRRIAERLAYEDSKGYDYKYERFLEHYLGGRDWHEEWDKADTRTGTAASTMRADRRQSGGSGWAGA